MGQNIGKRVRSAGMKKKKKAKHMSWNTTDPPRMTTIMQSVKTVVTEQKT